MSFLLDDQQVQLVDSVTGVLRRGLPAGALHRALDGDAAFDGPLWDGLCALGLAGMLAPEDSAGAGAGLFDAALVAEALGFAAAPVPFLGHSLVVHALSLAGGAFAGDWLPRLASGSVTATVALHDPGGWRPADWGLAGDGTVTGERLFVPAAGTAPLVLLGLAGGRLAAVEPGAPGVSLSRMAGIDRTRRLDRLVLDRVPVTVLPSSPGLAERVADAALVLLAADAFGGARRVLEICLAHARTRVQFGRPIGGFQAVRHQLANMATQIEPCRALWWHAALEVASGAETPSRAAAMAKAQCGETFLRVARGCVELLGGIGFTWDHQMHIWLKRAMHDMAWGGDAATHRLRHADLSGW